VAEKRKTSKRKSAPKPVWERGYNGHVLWLGKQKLGKITVHADRKAPYKYTWEAGKRAGAAGDLPGARKAVEYAVLMAERQFDLFN
jgi:hypothetical protein